MEEQEPHHAPVLSLSLHRLQKAPRAIHRAFLSRPTVFRVARNVKGLFHADGVGFLTQPSHYKACLRQMLVQARDSVLVVGPVTVKLDPTKNLKLRTLEGGVQLVVVDERVALFGNENLAVVMEGSIARALADLFQISIHMTSHMTSPMRGRTSWPQLTRLDLDSVDVAIARTWPSRDQAPVIESERLTLSAIRSSRRFIYAEVAGLTSPVIVKALIAKLKREDAPEVIIIVPPRSSFLQQAAIAKLLKADVNEKLRFYEGDVTGSLLIIDDQFVKIGTSVWTSRSLGAKQAVDIALEAKGRPSVVMGIARLRRERLGRLLNIEPSEFDARFLLNGTLIGTVESFFTVTRFLKELSPEATPQTQIAFTFSPILDPKRPQAIERWVRNKLRFGPKTWKFALIFATIFILLVIFSTLFAPFGL